MSNESDANARRSVAPYAEIGAKLIRLQKRSKRPVGVPARDAAGNPIMRKKRGGGERMKLGWQYFDPAAAALWVKQGGNVAWVIGREFLVLDFDPRNGPDTEARFLEAIGEHDWSAYAQVDTPGGGRHVIMRTPPEARLCGDAERFPGLDIKRGVSYVVCAGGIHPDGGVYQWAGEVSLAATPTAPQSLLDLLAISAPPPEMRTGDNGEDAWGILDDDQLTDALSHIDAEQFNHKNDEWLRFAMACHWLTAGDGREVFLDWCAGDDEYADEAMRDINGQRWDSFSKEGSWGLRHIGGGLLYKYLAAAGVPSGRWPQRRGADDFADVTPEENEAAVSSIAERAATPRVHIFAKGDPYTQALHFLADHYMRDGTATLAHHNGQWLTYDGAAYEHLKDNALYAKVFRYLHRSKTKRDDETFPFMPTPQNVTALLLALRGLVLVEEEAPCWRTPQPYQANEIIAAPNGLLHIPTHRLLPPTPNFFTRNAIDFEIDLEASRPSKFLKFANFMFEGDQEQIATLLELMGDDLCPNTRIARIEWFLGPGGAGKSTLMDLRDKLVGARNVISPSLSTFSNDHWGTAFLGKRRATFRDEKQPAKGWGSAVATALCKLATNDPIDVNPKNRDIVPAVRFGIRMTIVANRMIYLPEASGEIQRRSIVLRASGLKPEGERDPDLLDRDLLPELPGILLLALEGWARLRERGRFVSPAATEGERTAARRIGNEIVDFVERHCELDAKEVTDKDEFWRRFLTDYAEQRNGLEYRGARNTFYEALKGAYPEINTEYREDRPGTRDRGPRKLRGVRLIPLARDIELLTTLPLEQLTDADRELLMAELI